MKEKEIDYETALLAKEKGFDWEGTYEHVYAHDRNKVIQTWSDLDGFFRNPENNLHWAYAPTQAFLAKWLREEHRLFVNPWPLKVGASAGKMGYRYSWVVLSDSIEESKLPEDKSLLGYYSFEEAMEIALVEALKII